MKINIKNIFKVLVSLMVMLLILTTVINKTKVLAVDYFQESLYFDEDGSFFMTTHDIKATKSTRYCTLGWTIKRYNLPIDDSQNMCATIIITCDGSVEDPENEQYLYSYFYCDKDTIFDAIGGVSEEWQRELYLNGATVYLDGIMTVIENNVTLGSLSFDGSRSGEVYDTYEGIVSARNWGYNSKISLQTHFNKSVYFPAVKEFFEEEGEAEKEEKGRIQLDVGRWGPDVDAGINVSASLYNPSAAIPSGEQVRVSAWQQAYAYDIEYKKISGETACKIPITIIGKRTAIDDEGLPVETEVIITESTYELMMPYTYYVVDSVALYYADGMYVRSDALGGGCYVDTYYVPEVEVIMREGAEEHIMCEPVAEAVQINIGELTDVAEIEACIRAELISIVDKPKVRNDYLSIEGDVIMTDEWSKEAEAPGQSIYRVPDVSGSEKITIPVTTPNGSYSIRAQAYYGCMTYGNADADYVNNIVSVSSKINVHTPVACHGSVSDVKEWNQSEFPIKDNPTIVLGKGFAVALSNQGEHVSKKGYGENDYEKYVLCNQVRFPFDVIDTDGELISENTWLTIGHRAEFILPVTVIEGEYEVEYRTIAHNFCDEYTDYQDTEKNANLSANNYIATDFVTVEIVGALYGFRLTETVEYKRVTDLESLMGVCDVSALPFAGKDEGVPLGSYFRFQLESVGSYAEGATVTIVPSFWYIGQGEPTEVDIYYEDITADRKVVLRKWTGNYVIGTDNGENNRNNRHQLWSGIYMLPMKSYCLPKGANLPAYGVNEESFLEKGYILVKFDIRIEDETGENVLLYVNSENAKSGYCNRWEKEGGKDGEVIIYNTGKSVKDSMKITGTH